jgi:oxygen-dependent protoporphyrinogen oxidase
MPTKKVTIVGAGLSGLAVAWRLQQLAPDVAINLLEEDQRPGGTAWTLRADGFQLEIGPNGFLDNKPSTVDLCRQIGLGSRLLEASAAAAKNRYLFLGDRLHPLPAGPDAFLRSRLLSWRGKLNLVLERWRRARQSGDESIAAFARRRAGKEVADVFADALVTGIYAGDPRLLSLPACFPRLAAFERDFGSVIKGFGKAARQRRRLAQAQGVANQGPSKMWSFRDGMRLLVETLSERLTQPPMFGVSVRRLEAAGAPARPSWRVHGAGEDRWDADAVVLTCPAYRQAGLLADVDNGLADEIAAIPYNRVAVLGLGYRQADMPMSVDGFGYIAPQNTRRDLLGVQWCSSIFPGRAPEGMVLLRAMCGGWHRADVVGWDDDRLVAAVHAELRLAMGIAAEPVFCRIIRWERAIPQYHVGHLERLTRIDRQLARHPGLFLGGNAYRGVALNDCTEQGGEIAARVAQYLQYLEKEPRF